MNLRVAAIASEKRSSSPKPIFGLVGELLLFWSLADYLNGLVEASPIASAVTSAKSAAAASAATAAASATAKSAAVSAEASITAAVAERNDEQRRDKGERDGCAEEEERNMRFLFAPFGMTFLHAVISRTRTFVYAGKIESAVFVSFDRSANDGAVLKPRLYRFADIGSECRLVKSNSLHVNTSLSN